MSRRGKPMPINHVGGPNDPIACGFCDKEAVASAAMVPLCADHRTLALEIARDAGITDGHLRMSGRERKPRPWEQLHRCTECGKVIRGAGPAARHERACLGGATAKPAPAPARTTSSIPEKKRNRPMRADRKIERDHAIAAAYRGGESGPAIAERFGITTTRVLQVLERMGVQRRPRGWPAGVARRQAVAA